MTYIESYNTELKREYTPNIIKTIIASANTVGGKIYIGIEDDGTIVGVNDIDSTQLQLINAVNDTVKPDITLFITYKTENINNKNIIVIEVQKGTVTPYYIASKGIRPEKVLIFCVDGLKGFNEAISTVYPFAKIQKCIVHQIRASVKYIPYKDKKAFTADLKKIYGAVNEDAATDALIELKEKWSSKYPNAVSGWEEN